MLAQMAGHVLHGEAEFVILAQARMGEVESGIAKAAVECVVLVTEFPSSDGGGDLGECFCVEPKRLAHFTRSHAIAISNDVGGHRCTALAVFAVEILNDLFALVAAGKVEINVRPLTAFFREKALEE